MSKSKVSGSSISIGHEINVIGKNMIAKGTKDNTYPPLTTPTPDHSNGFSVMLPSLMGAVPAATGISSAGISLAMTAVATVCSAGGVSISPNPTGSGFLTTYANVLQYVTNGAYAKNGTLSENELRKLILALISQMLQKAGPGFSNWNQVLKGVMQNAAQDKFLLGMQSDICALIKDPVNANTGNFIYDKEDLKIDGRIPLSFRRFYNRIDKKQGCMGIGWRHNYEIQLLIEEDRYVIIWDDGREEVYMRNGDDSIEPLFGCLCRLDLKGGEFVYQTQAGLIYTFSKKGHLLSCMNKNGHGLQFTYNCHGRLRSVANGCGGVLQYQYDDTSGQLLSVKDHMGRCVSLAYELGRLRKATNAMGESYTYYYDDNRSLYKIQNPRSVVVLENKYDEKGRTIGQSLADGGKIQYSYQEEDCRTLVTQQDNSKIAYYHDERFRNVKTVYADGEEQFLYNDHNLLIQRTDKNGNKTKFAYDDRGNRTQAIYPDGSKHNMTYDAGNRLLVMTVNGITKTKNSYDTKGNIQKTEDALGRGKVFRYDLQGKITEIIQADQSSILLEYDNRGNITKATDAQGNTITYSYDELNRIIKTLDGNGNPTSYQYDACDQIKKVTNAVGKSRMYEYTNNGKLSKVVDFNGAVTSQLYNSMNQVKTVIFPDGGKQQLEYDLMQNVSRQVAPNGAETSYQYDILNRLEQITLANGGTISYEYDPNGNRTGVTDANGNHTSIAYDEMNRITTVTDPAGAKTEYEYDMDGNITSITDPLGKSVSYTYNKAGQKTKETDSAGNSYTYGYNELGKISCVTDSKNQKKIYEYSPGGVLAKITYPNGNFEQYSYDKNNNLICRENHKGDFLTFCYDCLNRMIRVTSSFGQEQSYTYDAVGNVSSMTDALGHVTSYTYSLSGKLTSVLDAKGNRTEYAYDAMGDLITICQHEGNKQLLLDGRPADLEKVPMTHYQRNLLGDVERITTPLGFTEEYSYDLAGQLIKKRDQDGFETHYTYTSVGDIESITYADGRKVALSYNPLRQLTEINDWLGITRIEMDDLGRTRKITDYKGREVAYRWNQEGKREAIVYPDGRIVSYEYDEASRISRLADGERDIKYCYDEDGRLAEKILPDGIHSHYTYNRRGLLSSLTYESDEAFLEKYSYEYDKIGNKISIQKNRNTGAFTPPEFRSKLQEENGVYQYRYDCLNRLTEVSKNREMMRRYAYDSFGNRTLLETESKKERYFFNAANQLVRAEGIYPETSYRYDARGNLTEIFSGTKLVNKYVYDETNRLTKAVNAKGEAAAYQYDGLGNRTGMQEYAFDPKVAIVQGTGQLEPFFEQPTKEIDYLLDRTKAYHNLLEKTDITEGRSRSQTYTWEREIAFMTEGDTTHIYLKDELGSPVRLVRVGENQQIIYGYDEFGQDLYENQGDCQPFGYTGYRKDRIAGTYFAQAREYLPNSGRFAGKDILAGKSKAPETLHEYHFCYNNPVNYVDLNGMDAAYIYYIDDFGREANWQSQQMTNKGIDVTMVNVTVASAQDTDGKQSALKFQDSWNTMDDTDSIDYVYIFSHGTERMLQFEDGSGYNALTIDGFNKAGSEKVAGDLRDLKNKDVTRLYIQACNTGLVDYYKVNNTNVASIMSTKLGDNSAAYAWNGSVSFGPPAVLQKTYDFLGIPYDFENRLSEKQDHFNLITGELLAKGLINYVTPMGQVTYHNGEYLSNGFIPGTSIRSMECPNNV